MNPVRADGPALVHAERVTAGLDLLATVAREDHQSPGDLIGNILLLIGEFLDADLTGLARVEGSALFVEQVNARGETALQLGVSDLSRALFHLMVRNSAMHAVVVGDTQGESLPAKSAAGSGQPIGAYSCVPLHRSDHAPYGVLFTLHPRARAAQDGELALLRLGGRLIVDALAAAALRHEVHISDQRVRAAYMAMACGVLILGDNGAIVDANLSSEEILGLTVTDMVGRPVEHCFREAIDAAGSPMSLEEGLTSRAGATDRPVRSVVLRITRSDAAQRWLQIDAVPIHKHHDTATEMVLSFIDISERMHAQALIRSTLEAQQAANERLAAVNRAKSDFIAIVSHEFRTPLTGILGFSEILRDNRVTTHEVQEFAADIHTDAKRLSRLVDEILDLDALVSGCLSLSCGWVNLNQIIVNVVAEIGPRHALHPIGLALQEELPPLQADRGRVEQVIRNLLANAVKFAPRGGAIEVESRVAGNAVRVSVKDHGIGIPEDQREHIFERYWRSRNGPAKYAQGAGLGLPLVRRIVEMHGGKVWVESELNCGSTFHFSLPLPAAA